MSENINIGVIIADIDEYRPFVKATEKFSCKPFEMLGKQGIEFNIGNARVCCNLCGIGKVNAAASAAYFVAKGYDIVLNFGLSGGLTKVKRGQLIIPDKFFEHDFDFTGLGYKPCEKPLQKYIYEPDERLVKIFAKCVGEYATGTAASGDCFVNSSEIAKRLIEDFGATTCDMETAAIASVCDMSGVPFLALRRISDDASEEAVDVYREMNTNFDSQTVLSDVFISALRLISQEWGQADAR